MSRPALAIVPVAPHVIQASAGVRLEVVHDLLRGTSRLRTEPAAPPPKPPGRASTATDSFFLVRRRRVVGQFPVIGFRASCGAGLRNLIHRSGGGRHSTQK